MMESSAPFVTNEQQGNTKERLNLYVKRRMSDSLSSSNKGSSGRKRKNEPDAEIRQEEKVHEKQPDLLTTILSQKKLSMMQDQDIVNFLQKFAQSKSQ